MKGAKTNESAGARLKAAILAVYELDQGELTLLDQVVELCDTLARVNAEVAKLESLTSEGSAGQTIEHPMLVAQRSHSLALAKLVEALRLPPPSAGEEETGESRVTLQARRAARARWEKEKMTSG